MTRSFQVFVRSVALLLLALPVAAQPRHHYALILDDPAVSDRFTTREATHSQAAAAYRAEIQTRQTALERDLTSRKFAIVGAVDTLSNAIFVAAAPSRLAELQSLPGVKGVIEMRTLKPRLNAALALAYAPNVWTLVGGESSAGAGIMVGVIGSGIDQNHPAFQDPSLSMPAGFPKCNTPADCTFTNNKVIVARSYVRELSVGSSSDATAVANDSGPDDYSPRDHSGEGTAIASEIAGAPVAGGAVPFSGMAPKAWLGNYRVESSPGMSGGAGQNFESVYVQALNDAFNDGMHIVNLSAGAIALYGPLDTGPVCGQAPGVPCDFLAYNFEKAAQMGMVITVAAGDDGENGYDFFNTGQTGYTLISSPATAPSVIAVGATMNSHVMQPAISLVGGPSNLQSIPAQTSDAYSADIASGLFAGAWPFALVDATQTGNDGYACSALPQYALYNSVALIELGNCSPNVKAVNAANAGATGIVFFGNTASAATPLEIQDASGNIPLFGPVVAISQSDGQNLRTYLSAHSGSSLLIDPAGVEMALTDYVQQASSVFAPGFEPKPATNQLLGFSSPGPVPGTFALKPDMVATGGFDINNGPASWAINPAVQDYYLYGQNGLYMATQSLDPNGALYSSNGYIAASGTSFAAPLVAGAAALLMQLHPNYTAAQVKAALVSGSTTDTFSLGDNWGDNVDALNAGAGRLDALTAANNGLIAQVVTSDGTNPVSISFGDLTGVPVSRSVRITNVGATTLAVTLNVSQPKNVNSEPGSAAKVAIDRTSLSIPAGAFAVVNLNITGKIPVPGEYTGVVNIVGTASFVHLPYFFLVRSGKVNDMQAIQYSQIDKFAQGAFEAPVNGDGGLIQIRLIDEVGVPVANSPVVFTVSPANSATLSGVAGHPGCNGAGGTSVTCNSDSYGLAWVDVTGGATAGATPTLTATAGSMSIPISGQILAAPRLTGISEAAVGSPNIAAGSYVSLYGTDLANSAVVGNNTTLGGDAPAFLPYPMNLDGVTVSFDVPGAYDGTPADYSGSPGYFTFVGQAGSQLNVLVPWELQGASSALVKVTVDGVATSNVLTIPLVTYAPQLFQNNGIAAAIDATTYAAHPSPVSASNPAHAGDLVELYGNGFGPVENQPASGVPPTFNPPPSTKSACTVKVGGQDAKVSYCGLAGYPAEYQINITIPAGVAAGNQPVSVTTGGATSQAAMLPIK